MPRDATPRRYLMCPPAHFTVTYSINPWMDPTKPVDLPLALAQWEDLRDRYLALGHTVELLDPDPALPDMVFGRRIEAAQAAGQADPAVDPRLATELLVGPLHHRWLHRTGPLDHAYAEALVEHALRGLTPRP